MNKTVLLHNCSCNQVAPSMKQSVKQKWTVFNIISLWKGTYVFLFLLFFFFLLFWRAFANNIDLSNKREVIIMYCSVFTKLLTKLLLKRIVNYLWLHCMLCLSIANNSFILLISLHSLKIHTAILLLCLNIKHYWTTISVCVMSCQRNYLTALDSDKPIDTEYRFYI